MPALYQGCSECWRTQEVPIRAAASQLVLQLEGLAGEELDTYLKT